MVSQLFVPFIMTLGVIMIAAPGAPWGAIMSALPFLAMIGIPAESELATLMIALYLTQDSFGTACNVSGDNALAVFIDTFKEKLLVINLMKKKPKRIKIPIWQSPYRDFFIDCQYTL